MSAAGMTVAGLCLAALGAGLLILAHQVRRLREELAQLAGRVGMVEDRFAEDGRLRFPPWPRTTGGQPGGSVVDRDEAFRLAYVIPGLFDRDGRP